MSSLNPGASAVNGGVGPLERGLTVLRELSALAAHDGTASVRPSDLVRSTGLARSVVDRVLATLERMGYVRVEGREVTLAVPLMDLGNAYLAASGLPAALGPFAERLADALDESVSVAVQDGTGVRFVVQVTRRRTMSLAFRIGDLLPAERCSPGALFAAEWDARDWDRWRARRAADPRDAGFPVVPPREAPVSEADFADRVLRAARDGSACDDQLIEPGLVAVSVPVRDPAGRVVCAVNVVSHTSRHQVDSLREVALGRLRDQLPAMEAALATGAGARTAPGPAGGAGAGGPASAAGPTRPADAGARAARTPAPGPAAGPFAGPFAGPVAVPGPVAAGAPGPAREPAPGPTGDGGLAGSAAEAAEPGAPCGAEDPARVAKRELGTGYLQSLARGLATLRALGDIDRQAGAGGAGGARDAGSARDAGERGASHGPGERGAGRDGMTLTTVAEATGLPRATARRSLLTLVDLGYVEAAARRFRPLPRVLELGYPPLSGLGLPEIATPHMRELVRTVHESASLTVLDGGDIRYVARVPTVRIMSVNITVGTRFPAYATSMGRVLLAGLEPEARAALLSGLRPRSLTVRTVTSVPELARILDRVAADGYALVDEELEEGVRSLAVPVRDAAGRVVAALNVATHAGRRAVPKVLRDLLPALRSTASRVEADLRTASAHHLLAVGGGTGGHPG